jgi:hypothetical protein
MLMVSIEWDISFETRHLHQVNYCFENTGYQMQTQCFEFFSDLMWDAGLPELPTHCFFTDTSTLTMFDLF